MDIRNFESILTVGENVAVEFKRCGSGIGNDVYESICSFLNRFGGDLFMGVEDDGTVVGLPEKAVPDIIKNFIKCISNSDLLAPTVYLSPDRIRNLWKGISLRSVKRVMSRLQQRGILIRKGNNRSGSWMINDEVLFDR